MKAFKTTQIILLACFIFFVGCNKEDELRDVTVNIKLIDENGYDIENGEDITVILARGQENYSGTTNSKGDCNFKNLPYGTFNVNLQKNGFVSEFIAPELMYRDNDTVDVYKIKMLEIPEYTVSIDSIARSYKMDYESRLFAYGTVNHTKGIPKVQYRLISYFGDNRDVSKDNYLFYHYTHVMSGEVVKDISKLTITNWANSYIVPPGADTLYVRFYPCAQYHEWITIREEALGTPSDVFKWAVTE